jgi:MFS family permease
MATLCNIIHILLSIIGDCAGFLASGLSVNFAMFFAARCIAGFFSSSRPIVASLITDATHDLSSRTKYLGISGACTGMGFTFGPPISVSINAIFKAVGISKFDAFRYTFLFAACVSFLSFMLACFKLQDVKKTPEQAAAAAAAAASQDQMGFVQRWRMRFTVLRSMGALLWTFLFLVIVQFFTAYAKYPSLAPFSRRFTHAPCPRCSVVTLDQLLLLRHAGHIRRFHRAQFLLGNHRARC